MTRIPNFLKFIFLSFSFLVFGCGSNPTVVESEPVAVNPFGNAKLFPNFSKEIKRYSVTMEKNKTSVAIRSFVLGHSEKITVDGNVFDAGQTITLENITPGDKVTFSLDNSNETYEIIFLPFDFPTLTVTTLTDEVADGLLFVNFDYKSSIYFLTALDHHGVPVWFKREEKDLANFTRHPNGQFTYALRTGETVGGNQRQHEIILLDKNFEEIDRFQTVGLIHTDHHDFHILPNGNHVFLAYEFARRNLEEFGGSGVVSVVDAVIQEVNPLGNVVFEWNSWGKGFYVNRLVDRSDYAHINSVFQDTDGNYIASLRHVSQVVKISRSTGNVLWRFGGKTNQFTFLNEPNPGNMCAQHTATRLENGNLLLFDNGTTSFCWPVVPERGQMTRIAEFELNESAKTAKLVWSYSREDAFTTSRGSSQRLPNGNTLIGWGNGPSILATEVNKEGEVVFEIKAEYLGGTVFSYRALKFDIDQ